MAPVVHSAPTAVQRPLMSAADKYKAYVRSNSNPNPQYDDNLKEPNNNNPDFKNPNTNNNNNNTSTSQNVQDGSPQFFTCYTSYSCTPTDVQAVQPNQVTEWAQKPGHANQGKLHVEVVSNNNQLNKVESGKPGTNAQINKMKNDQTPPQQIPKIKVLESSGYFNQMNQMNQMSKLKNAECGKPAPHAQLNNLKDAPSIQSQLIMANNVTPQQSPPMRCPSPLLKNNESFQQSPPWRCPSPLLKNNESLQQSPPRRCPSPLILQNNVSPQQSPSQRRFSKPVVDGKPQGQYGLAHSRSSPAIPSKSTSKSQNENLVLHYFQNPHTYKNLKESQLPGQGPVPKSMLPPPAPPADKSKSTSPRNSFNEKRGSLPSPKSDEGKEKDWSNVLSKFYNW